MSRACGVFPQGKSVWFIVLAVLATGCGGQGPHSLSPEAVERAATTLSLTSVVHHPVELYFDASGSMRGFGLAAATNAPGAGDAFGSFLDGVRAVVQEGGALPPTAGAAPPSQVQLFGSRLIEQPSFDPIVDAAVGRQAPPAGTAQAVQSSANCPGARWNGAAVSRANIDAMFGEATTCLDAVFRDVMANGRERVNLVVTDAEQNAPLNDPSCPNAQNAGTIQSYIAEWSRQGGVAAVIAVRLPYQSWQSPDTGGYCGCSERLLFAYVLAPFADDLERVLTGIREAWKGQAPPVYVPLNPRPALSYSVRVVADNNATSAIDFSTEAARSQLEPPDIGLLPQVWMVLKGDEGRLAVSVDRLAFATSKAANGSVGDRAKVGLEWRDPILLTPKGVLDSAANDGALSFVRLNAPLEAEAKATPANRRIARFLGASQEPEEELTPSLPPMRLRIRKSESGSRGCRWYLLEASTPAPAYAEDINRALGSLSSTMCLNWNAVRAQVKTTLQAGPSLRLLLHIDYE